MSTRQIFTKTFFQLSAADQAAVVDSEIHNRELSAGLHAADRAGIQRAIRRINNMAVRYGIYGAEEAEQ
jgi:hypothetical protein